MAGFLLLVHYHQGANASFSKKEVSEKHSLPLIHIGKSLHGFCEVGDGLIWIAVLQPVFDAVHNVPLQNHLAAAMQSGFGGIDLSQNVLAGHILVDHPVDGLHLTHDFLYAPVEILGIHTLFHSHSSYPCRGICIIQQLQKNVKSPLTKDTPMGILYLYPVWYKGGQI